ncbi:MAG TPA: hypothetical protein PKX87_02380 [Alphaproteobacteria bacterium]|nr:hypothetical protein [Alphaproteobacteria bacterium]
MRNYVITGLCTLSFVLPLAAHEHDMKGMHDEKMEGMEMNGAAMPSSSVSVKGEIVDMACYLDHGATGAKHAPCAKTCITSGLPVGLKAEDGKLYLLIGEHKPINASLADVAAKTITVKGKLVSRDGINMIENAEIVQ